MPESAYQYVLELYKDDGAWLGQFSVEADWAPAIEWTRLTAIRRGELPLEGLAAPASIEPVWLRDTEGSRIAGFQVSITANGGRQVKADFPTTYFRAQAVEASAYFVEQGHLAEGELFRYLVAAYPRVLRAGDSANQAEELPPKLQLHPAALKQYLRRSVPVGIVDAQDLPVFFASRVLEEAEELTRAHSGVETGGVLIGRLRQDRETPELFVEVTAQIPLRVAGEMTRLSFTPERWSEVEAALALRAKEETYLGYWHSHPVHAWCREKQNECCPEKLGTCRLARNYFSREDRAVLRTVFPRAYSLGLVVNDAPLNRLSLSLFGWRRGLIEPRGYYVFEGEIDA